MILEIRATLTKEMKIHIKHYKLTRARLASEKSAKQKADMKKLIDWKIEENGKEAD